MIRHGIVVGCVVSVLVLACSDEHGHHRGHRSATASPPASTCSEAITCETCTPVLGCGWCALPDGTGHCTSGPAACDAQQFSWTWEPTGCREPLDASSIVVHPPDAGTPEPPSPIDEPDAASDADAGP